MGLNHTKGSGKIIAIAGAARDIMAQGQDPSGTLSYLVTTPAMEVAQGLTWSVSSGEKAVNYFGAYIAAGGDFDATEDSPPEDSSSPSRLMVRWRGSSAIQTRSS